jgi:eukaryotic-like serine/threonine-protein kinase
MTLAPSCPSPEMLAQIGIGATGDSFPSAIATHIENCARCRDFLEWRAQHGLEAPGFHAAELPRQDALPTIDGFAIERELGRGAMGVVYLARRDTLSRQVALKLLPGGRNASPRERRQWLREAEAASLVRHPNVVTLHEVGEADDYFLLILEYISGGTLADRLSGPLAPRDAARLMETIARAVHHIHRHGQLHLDLKPSNILLDGDAGAAWGAIIPKVSDFGIARTAEPGATDTGGVGAGGSPPYMAPEQITKPREEMSSSADLHALGAILYHMLSGMPPYRGTTVLDTLEQVRNQEPVPPRRLIPQIPRDLETIALKCLQKNPPGRYASAEAMADDLRRWLDGRPISARPVSPPEILWRKCRRRPAVAALTTILMLVLSIGVLSVVLLRRQAEGERRRAEDEFHLTGQVLTEISTLHADPSSQQFLVLNRDNITAVLERTRNQLLRVRAQRPDDVAILRQMAALDFHLASGLADKRRSDESRVLLAECVDSSNRVLRQSSQDQTALLLRFYAYGVLGSVADQDGKSDESLIHLEQAVAHGEECLRLNPHPDVVPGLANCRWLLARALRRQGNEERAAYMILANLRMLDAVPKDDGTPGIAIWRTLVRLDLHLFKAATSTASAPRPDEADPLSRLTGPEADKLAAEDWAELVARCLSSSPGALDLCGNYTHTFIQYLGSRIAWQRNSGRMAEARHSADRLHAFARLLVERYPAQSRPHLAMCESFKQMAKNARHPEDRAAVEKYLTLAIEEARQALVLDSRDARAASEVADLQKRLDLFLASKSEL